MIELNDESVRRFESDQERYGTKVAMFNLLWEVAADILHGIGVKHIDTETSPPGAPQEQEA